MKVSITHSKREGCLLRGWGLLAPPPPHLVFSLRDRQAVSGTWPHPHACLQGREPASLKPEPPRSCTRDACVPMGTCWGLRVSHGFSKEETGSSALLRFLQGSKETCRWAGTSRCSLSTLSKSLSQEAPGSPLYKVGSVENQACGHL